MTLRRWKERAPPSSPSSSASSPPSSLSSSSPSSLPPRLALVSESPTSCYSGMLPGVISGAYSPEQALLPLGPLCAAAGFDLIVGKVRRVSSESREVDVDVEGEEEAGEEEERGKPTKKKTSSVLRLGYEMLSLDVGSTARGDFEKASKRSIAVKPVHSLLERLRPLFEACEAASASSSSSSSSSPPASLPCVVVVGGGAAGVEIAAAVSARLERAKKKKKENEEKRGLLPPSSSSASAPLLVSLVTGPRGLLPDESRPAAALVARELRRAGVRVVSGARVVSTPASVFAAAGKEEEGQGGTQQQAPRGAVAVAVGDGDGDPDRGGASSSSSSSSSSSPPLLLLPADFVLWCTGSRPHPWLRDRTDLELDDEGFIRVDASLRCRSRGGGGDDAAAPLPSAFAAGDCASISSFDEEDPQSPSSSSSPSSPPKSGVYAVRAGEQVLLPNLRAAVRSSSGAAAGGGGPSFPPPPPPPQSWSPSRQGRPALSLLSLGNGRAVALWPWRWVPAVAGRWVWLLKDFIDRRWVGR